MSLAFYTNVLDFERVDGDDDLGHPRARGLQHRGIRTLPRPSMKARSTRAGARASVTSTIPSATHYGSLRDNLPR